MKTALLYLMGGITLMSLNMSGCVNHPSYWSEESCEYCIQQNEHFSRQYKDMLIGNKVQRLEKKVKELEEWRNQKVL